ncbi:unnamed protein product [Candida verbasci]|uniref:Uncharacterized protein n=1 Tax=Candida verbasci TaxID=1227364 RepID=A0A9W4TS24_9ASCO|nr:unnamed protein product [Candida verbasci]
MKFADGLDPYILRQELLKNLFCPIVSLQSTIHVDQFFQSLINDQNQSLSTLQIFKPYGDNVKYSIPNQQFKITTTQLITKSYSSFPIRFEAPITELIFMGNAQVKDSIKQLFSISSLDHYLKQLKDGENDLYLILFDKIITSNYILAFDTFNHPIAQIFIIDKNKDSIEDLRKMIVEFRNFNHFPKYFQIDDLMIHVFILSTDGDDNLFEFQNEIKLKLNVNSTILPIIFRNDDLLEVTIENSTLESDVQRMSMHNCSKSFKISNTIDQILRIKINEFVLKWLLPHMQQQIRIWDDQILQPKKSITNKFLNFKKIFNNDTTTQITNEFNHVENYYYKSSSQQILRKLADWSLILRDFKYSYSIYDLIKKDYSSDKAWIYVSSTQEMCIISLLLAQTQQLQNLQTPDKNTLRKIRHDITEPYMDNLSYTYKSRFNLKTFNLRSLIIVSELLLCMSAQFKISNWWNDLIEKYLINLKNEFDVHLGKDSIVKAILLERLGYNTGKYMSISTTLKIENDEKMEEIEEGMYINHDKLEPTSKSIGMTKFRKSSLYYLLSSLQWEKLNKPIEIEKLKNNIIYQDTYLKDNLLINKLYSN